MGRCSSRTGKWFSTARPGASPDTQLTLTGPKTALIGVILKLAGADQLAPARHIQLDGDPSVFQDFAAVIDEFDPNFNIVTP